MAAAHALTVVAMYILVLFLFSAAAAAFICPMLVIWILRWARFGAVDFEGFSSWWCDGWLSVWIGVVDHVLDWVRWQWISRCPELWCGGSCVGLVALAVDLEVSGTLVWWIMCWTGRVGSGSRGVRNSGVVDRVLDWLSFLDQRMRRWHSSLRAVD